MQVEIINPQGQVSYRRPHTHPDVAEALHTTGYSVRFPKCGDTRLLAEIPGEFSCKVTVSPDGMTIEAEA